MKAKHQRLSVAVLAVVAVVAAALLASCIAVVIGVTAGYFGGWVDALLSRVIDLVMSVPFLLCALALGRSTKEMASELYLAESTVRGYMKALLAKLGVRSRIEALAVARKAQLI